MSKKPRHVLAASDLTPDLLFPIYERTEALRRGGRPFPQSLAGRFMVSLFEGESTRTRSSTQHAFSLLGGIVDFETDQMSKGSSLAKGETLENTGLWFGGIYYDLLIIRHDKVDDAAHRVASTSGALTVINCGCGSQTGEHPTQFLVDMGGAVRCFGRKENNVYRPQPLRITFMGDLLRGRTVRSFIRGLLSYREYFFEPFFEFVSPDNMQLRDDIVEELRQAGFSYDPRPVLTPELASRTDLLYVTRAQDEKGGVEATAEQNSGAAYALRKELLDVLPQGAKVFHPQPVRSEISVSLYGHPSMYFPKQAWDGILDRMGLCEELVLNHRLC